jgi:hypothetical protein
MALYSRGGLGNAKIAFRLRNGPDAVANEVTTLRGIQNLGMAESNPQKDVDMYRISAFMLHLCRVKGGEHPRGAANSSR